MESTQEKKKPDHVIKLGGVKAAAWLRTIEKNGKQMPMWSVTIDRTYKAKDGTWQHTSSFGLADLPKVALAANLAYQQLVLSKDKDGDQ